MDRDGVIGVLVGPFGIGTLGQRREGIGQTIPLFHLLTLFRGELTVAGNVLQRLIQIHIAGRLVQ